MTTPSPRLLEATSYDPRSDTTGRELKGRKRKLSRIGMDGWTALGLGVFAAVPAVAIGLLFAGVIGDLSRGKGSPWVVVTAGLVLATAAVVLISDGVREITRRRETAANRRAFPTQPWRWDYQWEARGSTDRGWREGRHALVSALVTGLIIVPANWAMITLGMSTWGTIVVLVYDCYVGWALWHGCYVALRSRKYGRPRLRAQRFPMHPGSGIDLVLERRGPLGALRGFDLTLRCVQERYEDRSSGKSNVKSIVCYELWAKTEYVEANPGMPLDIRFDVPAHLPGCALSERPPRYWELEVIAEAPGIDYAGVFLVPIYASVS